MISIIIVNHNGRRFLPRLLKSIYDQTFQNFEVILVDNDSTDDSVTYIQNFKKKIRLIDSDNRGYGRACNKGATIARGEYLIFLNEDMYLPPEFLRDMLNKYEELKSQGFSIGGIGCKMVDFDADPTQVPEKFGGRIDLFGFPVNKYYKDDIFNISGSPFFCEKYNFERIGGFSDHIFLYGEDVDLSWRYKISGYMLFMNNDTYLHHYGGGSTGGFGSEKVSLLLMSSLIPILNSYGTILLITILPLYTVYILSILIFITIFKGFDTRYAREYFINIGKIVSSLKEILTFRKYVQNMRTVSDRHVLKYISLIPAFFHNRSWYKLSDTYELKN